MKKWIAAAYAVIASTAVALTVLVGPVKAQSLGTAQPFGVLARTSVSSTGLTVINGDVGISPGTALIGFPPGIINGTVHQGDAVAAKAQTDAVNLYNSLLARPFTQNLSGQNLGGKTLTPGTYKFGSAADLNGILTLDGGGDPNALFVFQIGSTFTVGSGSQIVFSSAMSGNVFFAVGSSASIGDNFSLTGTIQAVGNVTAGNGTLTGRLISNQSSVNLTGTQIIVNQVSAITPEPGSLVLVALGLGLFTFRPRKPV